MKRELDAKSVKLIGVRFGISLALVSFLVVVTRETVLFVPGSPLPSCCNMAVIYMINIFIWKCRLNTSSVSVL